MIFALCLIIIGMAHKSAASDLNVIGTDLKICSTNPMTGYNRQGYCTFISSDPGTHLVCAKVNEDFLNYTKSEGNDLSSPRGGFPGLKPGDRWCLCVFRWRQAYLNGHAPNVVLNATHSYTLNFLNSSEPVLNLSDLSKLSDD